MDTSAWVTLYNPGDKFHQRVKHCLTDLQSSHASCITTDYIVDETLTFLLVRVGFRNAVQFGADILERKLTTLYPIESETLKDAWRVFKKFNRDKKWSFTDCTTYTVMKNQAIRTVLTLDRTDFSQMGFQVIPSE